MNTSLFRSGRALLLAALSAFAGSALATSTIGTRVDSYCAARPVQATAPQQSRPYRAANSSCFLCHTGSPTRTNLNAFGSASLVCTSAACGAAVDPFCVAHAPGNATITAPAAGTSVSLGQSLTFTASNATNPDGFPLVYAWSFSGGMPGVTGQSVSVPMTVAGSITATLQVRNSVGMLATGTAPTRTVTVTGGGGNQPPLASISAPAGDVTVAQGGTVNFQGSGSDPDNNTPLSYNWNFGGGATNSTAQNPGAVRFNTAGVFTVTFTVTDSLGMASAPVTRVVTVTGGTANQPPVASISAPTGNVTVAQGGTVTFQGSGNDPDGNTPLTYSWNFGGGAANSTAQNPGAVRFNTAGSYTVTFTVTDSLGLSSAPVTRTVTVTAPAPVSGAPVATIIEPAGNVTIMPGGTVTFRGAGTASASSSSDDGHDGEHGDEHDDDEHDGEHARKLTLRYNWNFGGGAPNSTRQNPGAVRFNSAGVFTVTFTVTDSRGRVSAPVTRIVTVVAPNQPPVASISAPADDVTITQGGTVTFQGSGSDPDGNTPLTYSWDFGGGAPDSTMQNPGAVKFDTVGSYIVTFTVTDSLGLASTPATRTVTVTAERGAAATIVKPAMNVSVLPGGSVTFSAEAAASSGKLGYRWSFPGGRPSQSTSRNPGAVKFASPGSYTVTLTVTDSQGNRSTFTRVVTVAAANQSVRLGDCLKPDDHDD
ncbi:MAG TPA: PKD domain-containing protein [Sideroxyarcus sp.]|nr:PKD domain-containing protein [Sideroxyarcus sp.]